MSLVKRTYVDGETVITAENLNDIQEAIIENEDSVSNLSSGKQDKLTGAASSVTTNNLTPNRVMVSNASGKIAVASEITTTELGYLDGATENIPSAITNLKEDISQSEVNQLLLCDEIPDTTQTYTFTDGAVTKVTHTGVGSVAVRTDTFTYLANSILEQRKLNTGEELRINTNLTTLETTVTYIAA